MTRPFALSAAVLLACAIVACGRESGPADVSELVAIDGSSTVYPITEGIAEEFQAKHPGARITVGESGTSSGMQKLCRGEIVIADASRPISATEIEACGKATISYIELPVAYDGLAVVVNPKNTWVDSMTVAELKRLWEPPAEGKITRWSQVRASWPDREIHLFGPGVASGTFDYFNEVINGNAKASRGDYTSSEDDNVLVQGVSGDELALGYFGLAYFEQNRDRLKLVPIDDEKPDNGAGPILPAFEAVRAGTYRPLSRPLFIYVNSAALKRTSVQQFVEFYLAAPNDLIQRVGYVPLTDVEKQLTRERFEKRAVGTMFAHPPAGGEMQTLEQRLKGGR
jgi:phosphate transport system substrate-binding protein